MQISGARLNILVNGKTFICKYIFQFFLVECHFDNDVLLIILVLQLLTFVVCKIIIIVILIFRSGVMSYRYSNVNHDV